MPNVDPRNIVVVDDNPATLYATSRVLRNAGFQVREARTGEGGVSAATTLPVDLVVLDIDLPDFDGYEVCRRIRSMESSRRVRVVYLSASFIDDSHRVRGFEEGADGFLTHPVDPAVLIATVGALLRTRAIEQELEAFLERERLARAEAERANRAKDEFLAILSHELRTPLTAIVGWAEVARVLAQEDARMRNAMDVIVRNAKLQSQLISDLLDVSSISAGKMLELELTPTSVTEVVEHSLESSAALAAAQGVHIVRDLAPEAFVVMGNRGRLLQIVTNLLGNAIKFSQAEGTVYVTTREDAEVVTITIRDEGRGIGSEALARIFDRFWQEENGSRRRHGGLGLGLSIVKHLTALHGGTIEAQSEGEGRGATFTLTLPLAADSLSITAEHAVEVQSGELGASLRGLRVFVVDDDQDGRRWIAHIIKEAGATTADAGSVTEALAAIPAFEPDVVVSDLAMPERDGFDLIAELRGEHRGAGGLAVIALSAFATADDRRQALARGFDHFIAKPPAPQDLVRAIRRVSRRRRDH